MGPPIGPLTGPPIGLAHILLTDLLHPWGLVGQGVGGWVGGLDTSRWGSVTG